jgi:cytosine/adenosine deaminase-related metal-dependent hydrolase
MAFQGEYFVDRYGPRAAEATPPITRMLTMDLPVGAGTDATRVASYNPWVCLYWLTQGKTVGGLTLTPERNRLERDSALGLWTRGSAWFSGEEASKGTIAPGAYADLAVLSADYLSVPGDEIRTITSVLTLLGGEIVHADADFASLAPPLPPASPDWSPVRVYGGHRHATAPGQATCTLHRRGFAHASHHAIRERDAGRFWGALGCSCFAF